MVTGLVLYSQFTADKSKDSLVAYRTVSDSITENVAITDYWLNEGVELKGFTRVALSDQKHKISYLMYNISNSTPQTLQRPIKGKLFHSSQYEGVGLLDETILQF